MIYGNPAVLVEDDTTDLIGIRTLVLSQMWQPAAGGAGIAQLDAAAPSIPAVPGGLSLIGTQNRRYAGAMRTTWTFEGVNGDGKTVTFKDRNNSLDYSFEPGFKQVPIARLPHIQDVLKKYGGTLDPATNTVTWPQTMPSAASNSVNGLSGGNGSQPERNPMLGVQDYFSIEGTYRFRYASLDLPGTLYSDMSRVFNGGLPGIAPSFGGRNWLKMPTHYMRRGIVFDITEFYWLSDQGGWNPAIFEKGGGG